MLVIGVVYCGALLPCVMFCGAVLSRGAVLLRSAVMLRCCWCLLCPPVACPAVLCCALGWLCCFLTGCGVCVLWCFFPRAVCSLSAPLCAVLCLAVLAVVPCIPVSCAVGRTVWWVPGAGRGPGLTVTEVEGSPVLGLVWPAAVVVCGGWMTVRGEIGMLTRVWTESCWVAASVVAAAAGGRGGWVVVGGGSWFGLGFGLGRCHLGCRRCVCGIVSCVGWCWWWCCCWWCDRLGAGLDLGSGFRLGSGSRLRRTSTRRCEGAAAGWGGVRGVLPGCLGRLCGGRGAPGCLACGGSFGFGRGLVDEVRGEGGVGG